MISHPMSLPFLLLRLCVPVSLSHFKTVFSIDACVCSICEHYHYYNNNTQIVFSKTKGLEGEGEDSIVNRLSMAVDCAACSLC